SNGRPREDPDQAAWLGNTSRTSRGGSRFRWKNPPPRDDQLLEVSRGADRNDCGSSGARQVCRIGLCRVPSFSNLFRQTQETPILWALSLSSCIPSFPLVFRAGA